MNEINIDGRVISPNSPSYFIADIAANHDNDIDRAVKLIHLAAESGADAVKFQHFTAQSIVSDKGFKKLGSKSHQASWNKSVYEIYDEASVSLEWTSILLDEAKKAGISFFTSPYSFELVDAIDEFVPAYKIGSGDITWLELIEHIAKKGKPVIIASGASDMTDIKKAINVIEKSNSQIALLQCNTNYTADINNFKYINLNVINSFKNEFPNYVLGLSDHTIGASTVLASVALGARVIEKHFTDDRRRVGPDHAFSTTPDEWRFMVNSAREIENALGDGVKKVEKNEIETSIMQRRGIYLSKSVSKGDIIKRDQLVPLRPCLSESISVSEISKILGKKYTKDINKGESLNQSAVSSN